MKHDIVDILSCHVHASEYPVISPFSPTTPPPLVLHSSHRQRFVINTPHSLPGPSLMQTTSPPLRSTIYQMQRLLPLHYILITTSIGQHRLSDQAFTSVKQLSQVTYLCQFPPIHSSTLLILLVTTCCSTISLNSPTISICHPTRMKMCPECLPSARGHYIKSGTSGSVTFNRALSLISTSMSTASPLYLPPQFLTTVRSASPPKCNVPILLAPTLVLPLNAINLFLSIWHSLYRSPSPPIALSTMLDLRAKPVTYSSLITTAVCYMVKRSSTKARP